MFCLPLCLPGSTSRRVCNHPAASGNFLYTWFFQNGESSGATVKDTGKGDINLVLDPAVLPDKPEGYQLEVSSGKVEIKAGTPAGILNGVQTLRQIIKEKDGKYMIQRASVSDY